MPQVSSLRSGLRLRTIVRGALALALAVILLGLGAVMSRTTLQAIEKEEGNKLAAEAKYFAELLDLTIGQQLNDLRSRATVMPQLGLHRNSQALSSWLTSIQRDFSDYTWIGFADTSGTVVASTGELLKGKSVAAREWFIRGKNHPVTVDLHPALMLETSLPTRPDGPWRFIDLATPVHDRDGRLLGVLGAHLSWDWLISHHQRFSDSLSRHRHADIVVAGSDGIGRLTAPASRVQALGALESFQRAAAGESGWILERWPEGQTYLVGHTRNPGYGEQHQLGWVTLIRLPQEYVDEIAAPALQTAWLAVGTAIVLLAIGVPLLLGFAIRPIETFAARAKQVAQEGGYMDITPGMSRELQVLAQATNDMIDALKEREAFERAQMRFIADTSHETRNPLQGALGYMRLIQARKSTPQDVHDSERAIEGLIAATDVSNDTLDVSAHEAGHLKLSPTPCQLRQVILSAIAISESRALAKGLTIGRQINIQDDLAVLVDRKRLRQVLLNLLSNAIKFTDSGSIDVRAYIASKPAPSDGNPGKGIIVAEEMVSFAIEVADTGAGMSAGEQRVVFERWQQALSGAPSQHIGYGLGLGIVKTIIEAMHGTVDIESVLGKGTTVRIWLSLPKASPPAASAASQSSTTAPSLAPALPKPLRIMVVDDMDINREVFRRWLQMRGHDVTEAASGTIALARAQDTAFDLILMDIDLPDIGGREVAMAIRHSPSASRDAMICAVSGHGFAHDVQASMSAGMDRHLVKPVDFAQLEPLLDEVYLRAGRKTAGS